jgi:hypothetical protein
VLLMSSGGLWGPTPPPGVVIVPGPDDGSGADQGANLHRGLDPCVSLDRACEVDFFLRGNLNETASTGDESHFVTLARTPEPGSLLLIGGGLMALGLRFRLRRP